ncbi:MAG: glycosyl hydrolase family 18 protein [Bacteroidota bacterium]
MKHSNKNYIWLVTLGIFLFPPPLFAQFRVVGYVSLWANSQVVPPVSDSVLKRLTHLNIAFINPDSLGNLFLASGVDSLVEQAHSNKVKVLISVGGGKFNPFLDSFINRKNRSAFIDSLLQLALDHHFDGIDADIENENLTKNYEGFIIELSAALKKKNKLLTAALATWNGQLISDAALKKFEFINVMSYDQTGPWRPTEPGPHSTYEKAISDLDYWTATRHVPKNRINLGIPFYGYGFGTTYGESMSYGNIITTFPDAERQDTIMPVGGGAIYYNGVSTILRKTRLALKSAGGIMIWQILQDAAGTQSLLSNIDKTIRKEQGKD